MPLNDLYEKRKTNAKRSREWLKANPRKAKSTKLFKKFSITIEQYDAFNKKNGGRCHICLKPERIIDHRTKKQRALAVDHDHETGLIRGLLCANCNRAIGMLNEDPNVLREAADYLEYFNNITKPGVKNAFDKII